MGGLAACFLFFPSPFSETHAHIHTCVADHPFASWYWDVTVNDPTFDVSPYEVLHRLGKTFVCPPGECGSYSSVGYMLLGLVLVHLDGANTWQELDQKAVIPTVRCQRRMHACTALYAPLPQQSARNERAPEASFPFGFG